MAACGNNSKMSLVSPGKYFLKKLKDCEFKDHVIRSSEQAGKEAFKQVCVCPIRKDPEFSIQMSHEDQIWDISVPTKRIHVSALWICWWLIELPHWFKVTFFAKFFARILTTRGEKDKFYLYDCACS